MMMLETIIGFLPPWVPFATVGMLLIGLGGAVWAWGNAREEAGTAKTSTAVNATSLRPMTEQLDRNQAIADRLDKITGQRAETIREVHFQTAPNVCRDASAMRALDGRLRYQPDPRGGDTAVAGSTAQAVRPASRQA